MCDTEEVVEVICFSTVHNVVHSGRVVECQTCDHEVADSNLSLSPQHAIFWVGLDCAVFYLPANTV